MEVMVQLASQLSNESLGARRTAQLAKTDRYLGVTASEEPSDRDPSDARKGRRLQSRPQAEGCSRSDHPPILWLL